MLAASLFLLKLLAAEKQLSAKACPCPVDKIQPRSDIRFLVLHTLLLDNRGKTRLDGRIRDNIWPRLTWANATARILVDSDLMPRTDPGRTGEIQ